MLPSLGPGSSRDTAAAGWPRSVLRRELTQRGVDRDLIDEVLVEAVSVESEYAAARALVDKKLRADVWCHRRRSDPSIGGDAEPQGLLTRGSFAVVREALTATPG